MNVTNRVLVVADWRTDPYAVVAACRTRASQSDVRFALVVPAWLHGLDWAGDPHASRPCAARQLETIMWMAETARLEVDLARVGDADPTSAVDDALQEFAATEILLCRQRSRRRHALDLAHRLRRMTTLPVDTLVTSGPSAMSEWRRWRALLHGGHCAAVGSRPRAGAF